MLTFKHPEELFNWMRANLKFGAYHPSSKQPLDDTYENIRLWANSISQTPKEVETRGYGNCYDLSSFMRYHLTKMGIDSILYWMISYSGKNYYHSDDFMCVHQFIVFPYKGKKTIFELLSQREIYQWNTLEEVFQQWFDWRYADYQPRDKSLIVGIYQVNQLPKPHTNFNEYSRRIVHNNPLVFLKSKIVDTDRQQRLRTSQAFKTGEDISWLYRREGNKQDLAIDYMVSPLMRHLTHSDSPNCRLATDKGLNSPTFLQSTVDLPANAVLTIDFRNLPSCLKSDTYVLNQPKGIKMTTTDLLNEHMMLLQDQKELADIMADLDQTRIKLAQAIWILRSSQTQHFDAKAKLLAEHFTNHDYQPNLYLQTESIMVSEIRQQEIATEGLLASGVNYVKTLIDYLIKGFNRLKEFIINLFKTRFTSIYNYFEDKMLERYIKDMLEHPTKYADQKVERGINAVTAMKVFNEYKTLLDILKNDFVPRADNDAIPIDDFFMAFKREIRAKALNVVTVDPNNVVKLIPVVGEKLTLNSGKWINPDIQDYLKSYRAFALEVSEVYRPIEEITNKFNSAQKFVNRNTVDQASLEKLDLRCAKYGVILMLVSGISNNSKTVLDLIGNVITAIGKVYSLPITKA